MSENTAVATVTQEGLVTAVAKGTTFVSVVSKANASVSAKITLTVIDGEIDVNTTPRRPVERQLPPAVGAHIQMYVNGACNSIVASLFLSFYHSIIEKY